MKYVLIGIVVVLVLMSGFVFGAVNGSSSGGTATGVVEVATQTP
jgi:hypothetical protein